MIQYKFLEKTDEEWFKKIVEKFRHQEVSNKKADEILGNPLIQVQLAYEEEDVVGYTMTYRLPRMDNGTDMMLIHHCFVAEEYKRQGVATTMMDNLLDYCKENNLHYAFLITQEDNEAANNLYHKLNGELHPINRNVYYWYFSGKPQI